MSFTHLHLHTEYSLLDGAIKIKELPQQLKQLGMKSCAITDHGVMYGVLDFYREMKKAGIKPIIGCEMYLAARTRWQKEVAIDRNSYHLVVLAENNRGYKNLMQLVSAGFTEGYYFRPRIDHELLEKHHEGLIVLSACLGGEVAQAILQEDMEKAKEIAAWYKKIMGPNSYYLELQDNGIPDQYKVNAALIQIGKELEIPLVATNDCHYLKKEDYFSHDVLLCMQTGKKISDENRMKQKTDAFYLKSPAEMEKAFKDIPEAVRNTERIAARCDVEIEFGQMHLPHFEPPAQFSKVSYLTALCEAGLKQRLEQKKESFIEEAYLERLHYELDVIVRMGFADYYLIVWDFIRFARENGIMVGPGRGSGAGSLAAWCLQITNIDPLQYHLIFERFLNADRVSMPDFDIDFCYERRNEVIDYVTNKYGSDRVAQVITFGTLQPRACIRDVARALDVPYVEADRIAKLIPRILDISLEKAMELNPDLKKDYLENETTKQIIDLSRKFEGMPRHASTHAAGVVISEVPLTDIAPLARNDEATVVQFSKDNLEDIGLLKFDFLGLRTLTMMHDCAQLVLQNKKIEIDFENFSFADAEVYKMISRGETEGVFQLESSGMTVFMQELKPENLEDIIAGISLYRPGPMKQIPQYIAGRHDAKKIVYAHPLLEPILRVTYGCSVYQEQVMQIVRDLAGFSLGQADNIRRAMSKKKPEVLAAYQELFLYGGKDEKGRDVPGALAKGISLLVGSKIWDEVMEFAGYAFNKSHAAAYAVIGYQTAWLRHYHPIEFMAAMLNSYLGNIEQAAFYVAACKKMGILVRPPDINQSFAKFTTEDETVRFALAAVKNVGLDAIERLIADREKNGKFKSYGDFLRRSHQLNLNKKMIESLAKSSALDCFGIARVQLIAVIEPFMTQLSRAKKNSFTDQLSLFDQMEQADAGLLADFEPDYPSLKEYSDQDKLNMEKEMLGLYISGHPLEAFQEQIQRFASSDSRLFKDQETEAVDVMPTLIDQQKTILVGMLRKKKIFVTKKNEQMAFLSIEDIYGTLEVIVFAKLFQSEKDILTENQVLLLAGRVSKKEEDASKLIAEHILPLTATLQDLPFELKSYQQQQPLYQQEQVLKKVPLQKPKPTPENQRSVEKQSGQQCLVIRYWGEKRDEGFNQLLALLEAYYIGETGVQIYLAKTKERLKLASKYNINLSEEVLNEIKMKYGNQNVGLL